MAKGGGEHHKVRDIVGHVLFPPAFGAAVAIVANQTGLNVFNSVEFGLLSMVPAERAYARRVGGEGHGRGLVPALLAIAPAAYFTWGDPNLLLAPLTFVATDALAASGGRMLRNNNRPQNSNH